MTSFTNYFHNTLNILSLGYYTIPQNDDEALLPPSQIIPIVENNQLQKIIDDLDDFDILLCNGQRYWFSYVVEIFSRSKYSHIGIVLKSPTWLSPELTGNYFFESGTERFPDAVDHKIKYGVQLTSLEEMISTYVGNIYLRKLTSKAYKTNPKYYQDKFTKLYNLVKNKPYDNNVLDLFQAEIRRQIEGSSQKLNTFFCSALVSFILTQFGFLPPDTKWDLIQPKDFAPDSIIDKELEKMKFATLGKLEHIYPFE